MTEVVMGLDMSLRGTGICILPGDWNPRRAWQSIALAQLGEIGKQLGIQRRSNIAHEVWRLAVREGVTHAFVEQHAFSAGLMKHAMERAELVGAMKEVLWHSLQIEALPIVASSARKLLFGSLPRMDRKAGKAYIKQALESMGGSFGDEDTRDAFIVANAGRAELGLPCLAAG
jgi:hypothetical protein